MINLKALEKANKVIVTYTVDDIDSEYVKVFRKEHNLSQTALANLMGVCQTTVMHWESGKSKVSDSCAKLFTLFSKNCNLINDIRKAEYLQGEEKMTPLTITKDEYSGKYVAWHLPKQKIANICSLGKSRVFWKIGKVFYLIGDGETKEEAVTKLEYKVTDFTNWLIEKRIELSTEGISSNLPEYRQAIYEFNTENR